MTSFKVGDLVVLNVDMEPVDLADLISSAGWVTESSERFTRARFLAGIGSSDLGMAFSTSSFRSATAFEIALLRKEGKI